MLRWRWRHASPIGARESASRYLKSAGRNGEHYQAALELLVQAETRLAEVERLRPGLVFRDCRMCPLLVVVPDGRFVMGSPESEGRRWPDEGPQHWVWIGSPFAVGVYEVTFSEWDECVAVGGCNRWVPGDEGWGRGSRPVINVSWEDAQAYVEWLSRQTGEQYRLLSEAGVGVGRSGGNEHVAILVEQRLGRGDGRYSHPARGTLDWT